MSDGDTTAGKKAAQKPSLERLNTKKAKPNDDEVIPDASVGIQTVMENTEIAVETTKATGSQNIMPNSEKTTSYKDSLMRDDPGMVLSPDEIVQMVAKDYEEFDFEGKESVDTSPFNPKPTIEVTLEEYDSWCKPWKSSLIVKLLRKTLGFRSIESWILRQWKRQGDVRVMDLSGDYFLLVPVIDVLGRDFKVEYEGLHLICFGCGKYGHRIEQCLSVPKKVSPPPATVMEVSGDTLNKEGADLQEPMIDSNSNSNSTENLELNVTVDLELNDSTIDDNPNSFGPWMLAKKNQRRRTRSAPRSKEDSHHGHSTQVGSRFSVLGHDKHDEDGPNRNKKPEPSSTLKPNFADRVKKTMGNKPDPKSHSLKGVVSKVHSPHLANSKGNSTKSSLITQGIQGTHSEVNHGDSKMQASASIDNQRIKDDYRLSLELINQARYLQDFNQVECGMGAMSKVYLPSSEDARIAKLIQDKQMRDTLINEP
ncbi:hypothetical protein PIB30_076413 [Stylosanthes scabra]|uniref:CCHC-type domain-containing protein n=1 Tax=Stylosanthes scabra TaxID=79078 RepID=A0ABU6VS54_9FABA|nr:hypothetical protein [Stylosanthes scabra]